MIYINFGKVELKSYYLEDNSKYSINLQAIQYYCSSMKIEYNFNVIDYFDCNLYIYIKNVVEYTYLCKFIEKCLEN